MLKKVAYENIDFVEKDCCANEIVIWSIFFLLRIFLKNHCFKYKAKK